MTWDPFLKVLVVVMRMAPCYLIFVEKKFELLNPYESFQTFFSPRDLPAKLSVLFFDCHSSVHGH